MTAAAPRPAVLDASVTLAWLFNEGGQTEALSSRFAALAPVVPWLWRLEVVQTLLVRERRERIDPALTHGLIEMLDYLAPEVAPEPIDRTLLNLATFARPHQLSAYDAVYLDLAVRRGLPLLTFDKNLIAAAERVGVGLVGVNAAGDGA